MDCAQQNAERNIVMKIKNVAERLDLAWVVIKHEQDAGKSEDDEQVERDPAHSPCIFIFDGVAVDLGGMQVEENVGQNRQRPVARRLIVLDAKDRPEKLRLFRLF